MLQLPETPHSSPSQKRHRRSGSADADPAAHQHALLNSLESPIGDARLMASILANIACNFSNEFHAYGSHDIVSAKRMASDFSDDIDQLLFAAYQVEKMLRNLERQYHAEPEATHTRGGR